MEVTVTVYPDTKDALATAREACGMVARGETAEPGHRDEYLKAQVNLRLLRREIEARLAEKGDGGEDGGEAEGGNADG